MKERERLGIGINQQIGWKSRDAFAHWRATIEKQGISVFIKKYPWADSRGFSLYDDPAAPAIVINKSEEVEVARTFSLLHEYAHLLIRRPGVSDHNPKNPVEAFCNRFAAAFLMPDAALRKLLPHWPNEPVEWSSSEIDAWAKALKVSRVALALRLEHAGLAPQSFFMRFNRQNAPAPTVRKKPKPDPNRVRVFELGGTYQSAVISALERDVISEVTAVQALGLAPEKFDLVRSNLDRQRALAGG
jgi:Zn-dependent peptidase ImmA (M78 family)